MKRRLQILTEDNSYRFRTQLLPVVIACLSCSCNRYLYIEINFGVNLRRWHDDEDSHQSCTVVMLLRIETDQIYHTVSAITVITHAKHCCHCSGSQPVRLLQCCLRWSSSLWHPATTVSPQHSRTSGRRLIATRSRDFSAMRPPLAASQTARRVAYKLCMMVSSEFF